ncbi:uncharacterized protein TNCV_3569211 [Trichonephila clavipes]|nr:uncharacterized protein TNCV_3569211 [Trichonephila clavipes]
MESTILLNQIAESFLPEIFQPKSNDLINMHTFKYRILNDLMVKLDLTFQGLNQWINTHTPVDPEVAKAILRCAHNHDGIKSILAQNFVKNERLNRLIQNMVKNGQSTTPSVLF